MHQVKNLLTLEDGKLTGPMSPVMAGKEMANRIDIHLSGLLRIEFDDPRFHQIIEERSLTGHDTLVLISHFPNEMVAIMFVDEGYRSCVAGMYTKSNEELWSAPVYEQSEYVKKLGSDQIKEILLDIINNDLWKVENFDYSKFH